MWCFSVAVFDNIEKCGSYIQRVFVSEQFSPVQPTRGEARSIQQIVSTTILSFASQSVPLILVPSNFLPGKLCFAKFPLGVGQSTRRKKYRPS